MDTEYVDEQLQSGISAAAFCIFVIVDALV
jgi:hypothetical protein